MPEETPPAPDPKPPAKKRQPPRKALPVITPNRKFAAVVVIVTAFMFSAFVALIVFAFASKDPPTAMQKDVAEVCKDIVKVSLGALVGLLGGRVATPDRIEVSDQR